ncbi:prostaglandin-E synthase, partial [Sarracenia purpurea var. burkii]
TGISSCGLLDILIAPVLLSPFPPILWSWCVPLFRSVAFKVSGWVDSHLVHVLSPNIYRNAAEALESFDYITSNGNFSFTEKLTVKYAGAAAMYFVSKNLKKKYNITDERAALYESAETWVDALNGRDFLGGSKPNLADLAVFGVLRPIRYLRSGRDMIEQTRIGEWYTRMETAVGESSRIKA